MATSDMDQLECERELERELEREREFERMQRECELEEERRRQGMEDTLERLECMRQRQRMKGNQVILEPSMSDAKSAHEPYSHVLEYKQSNGDLVLKLPACSWAAAMLLPLLKDPDMPLNSYWMPCFTYYEFNVVGPQFISVALTVAGQGLYCMYLRNIVANMEHECLPEAEGTDLGILRLLCIGSLAFVVYSSEIHEVLQMTRWLSFLPNVSDVPADSWLASRKLNAGLLFRQCVDHRERLQERTYTVFATTISMRYRIVGFLAFILPKFLLASVVFFYAAGHVAYSESAEDLMLNAVASAFILDLDNIVYSTLSSETTKRYLEELPPVGKPMVAWTYLDMILEWYWTWVLLALLTGTVAAVHHAWCTNAYVLTSVCFCVPVVALACCLIPAGRRRASRLTPEIDDDIHVVVV